MTMLVSPDTKLLSRQERGGPVQSWLLTLTMVWCTHLLPVHSARTPARALSALHNNTGPFVTLEMR